MPTLATRRGAAALTLVAAEVLGGAARADSPGAAADPPASSASAPSATPYTAAPSATPYTAAPSATPHAAAPSPATPAAPPTRAALNTARELFIQAEHDEDAGDWSDALDKLRQISLIKMSAGVRYHLALCEEHLGSLVEAMRDFGGAQEQARADHVEDVLRLVGDELANLGPRVPKLLIHVLPENIGAAVSLDGEALDTAHLGDERWLDPGDHHVFVHAPGYVDRDVVVLMRERDVTSLDIPMNLAPPPPPPAPVRLAEAPPPARRPWSPTRVGALATAGGAVALAGAGVGAFFAASAAHDRGRTSCAALHSTSSTACDGQKNAVRAWDWFAAGAWAGAAIAAAASVVLWTRSDAPRGGAGSLTWSVGPGGVSVQGTF